MRLHHQCDRDVFLRERKAALLSLDEIAIRRFAAKWGVHVIRGAEGDVFWIMVHKARTGATDLPEEARQASRVWLKVRGFLPLG